MTNYILFDDSKRNHLLPLVYTRPCAELRVGILTIAEKWSTMLSADLTYSTADYLSAKYPISFANDNVYINGRALPSNELLHAITNLPTGSALLHEDDLIAVRSENPWPSFEAYSYAESHEVIAQLIKRPYDIFSLNGQELIRDFALITRGRTSAPISSSNTVIGGKHIFLEEGAVCEGAILNDSHGPIYIGREAEIMEGAMVRGALALCDHSALKMGAKIYGATTIGPHSKVGGEVNNSVFQGYSNKGHDGFLGNSVLGEWCNIGADSNNSNLKNNYAEVKLWDYAVSRFAPTGLQFCGLIMGDHSKCGINTMFNTGTVVGVSANIFGSGFPRNYVPSFAWGGNAGFSTYQISKALETATLVMERRGIKLDKNEENILRSVFELSADYRFWDKK